MFEVIVAELQCKSQVGLCEGARFAASGGTSVYGEGFSQTMKILKGKFKKYR